MAESNHEQSDAAANDSPEGRVVEFTDPEQAEEALELAFDYRGDVTLTLARGEAVEGYLFDRRRDAQGNLLVRVLTSAGGRRESVLARDIVRLAFSGRDTAAGKSWETWVRHYAKRLAEKQTGGVGRSE